MFYDRKQLEKYLHKFTEQIKAPKNAESRQIIVYVMEQKGIFEWANKQQIQQVLKIQMANKHRKNASASLKIVYMQIKMRYTFSTLFLENQ